VIFDHPYNADYALVPSRLEVDAARADQPDLFVTDVLELYAGRGRLSESW
jgi:hypothetical protein